MSHTGRLIGLKNNKFLVISGRVFFSSFFFFSFRPVVLNLGLFLSAKGHLAMARKVFGCHKLVR